MKYVTLLLFIYGCAGTSSVPDYSLPLCYDVSQARLEELNTRRETEVTLLNMIHQRCKGDAVAEEMIK